MWGRPKVAGFAVTVELEPLSAQPNAEQGGAHILTGAIAEAGPDDVIVVANGGRTDVSSWGGIVNVGAAVRSVRGVITDGACRDMARARDFGADQADSRRTLVVLTPSGKACGRAIWAAQDALNETVRNRVSQADLAAADAVLRAVFPDGKARQRVDERLPPPAGRP